MGDAVSALQILITILADASFALLVGVLLAGRWLANGTGSLDGSPLRQISVACFAVILACHLARPWLVAASMTGSTEFREISASIPAVLSATRQGALWYASCVAVLCLSAALFALKIRSALAAWTEVGALCMLAAAKAASSHAAEAGGLSLPVIVQFFHLAATAVWAGAVLVSAMAVVPRLKRAGAPALWRYGARLSQTVTYALIVLVATGLYTSWSDMHGAVARIGTTAWGKTLLVKVALAALAALLGSLVRFRCLRLSPDPRRAAAMETLMRCEAGVMVAILCLSGVLGNTAPGA